MTLIVLGAVMLDRRALTMRNLALAVLAIVALEPEAIARRQLPALVRRGRGAGRGDGGAASRAGEAGRRSVPAAARAPAASARALGLRRISSTSRGRCCSPRLCATSATASFMAYHFHDLSPYVLIGNPLTLTIIELFAVPGALHRAALYPLGLDAPVWLYVGAGIKLHPVGRRGSSPRRRARRCTCAPSRPSRCRF